MGQWHARQLLEDRCPSARLTAVVEPWFMGKGKADGGKFEEWKDSVSSDVSFSADVSSLPPATDPRLSIISARTADCPRYLSEAIAAGSTAIYLEKPGAPTVAELVAMKEEAEAAGVKVLMGYNKNVCKYVSKVRTFAEKNDGVVTFVSNNAYEDSDESLGECFERNSEGMLKNMAIHELALMVSFYGVSVDTIESVVCDRNFTKVQTLKGPSGQEFTDFSRVKFTIKTWMGTLVTLVADRCGGSDSYGVVKSASSAKELFRYDLPDEDDKVTVAELGRRFPDAMPYFLSQDNDYVTLKEAAAKFCLTKDESEVSDVASIDVGIETLKVAEYLTPHILRLMDGYR